MSLIDRDYVKDVYDIAAQVGVDPVLMLAIIEVETSGCRWATRFEPYWAYKFKVEKFAYEQSPKVTSLTEEKHQMTSWGLMQCMGSVARELGFTGHLPEMTQTRTGLTLGMKQFLRVKRNGYSVDDNIAAYNAGSAHMLSNGLYQNQPYVDKVNAAWTEIKALLLKAPLLT